MTPGGSGSSRSTSIAREASAAAVATEKAIETRTAARAAANEATAKTTLDEATVDTKNLGTTGSKRAAMLSVSTPLSKWLHGVWKP
jgi:hypothetical protein